MRIEDTTLVLPGLTRTYTFYHFSDAHIAHAEASDSEHDRRLAEQHAEQWSYKGTTPKEALDQTLAFLREQGGDGLFACGDLADYVHPSNFAYLEKALATLPMDVTYVCGNHEGVSYEHPTVHTDCYPMLAPLTKGNPHACVKDYGEFLVAALDDGLKTMSEEQLTFLRELAKDGRPILLLLHVPIWTEAIHQPVLDHWPTEGHLYFSVGKAKPTEIDERFLAWLADEESHVAAIFAGHVHFAHEGEFAPGRMQYTSAPAFEGYVRRITLCGS